MTVVTLRQLAKKDTAPVMERIQETGVPNQLLIDGVTLGTADLQIYERELIKEIQETLDQMFHGKLKDSLKKITDIHKT